MFRAKNQIVIGLTTYDIAFLRLSVPALGRLKRNFTLIIHNDNPAVRLSVRDVRHMGYRGRLHIINATQNIGLMQARLAIVAAAARYARHAKWIMFAGDDDIVVSADLAPARPENFAIIQNGITISNDFDGLMHAVENPASVIADGKNITMCRPSLSMFGALVRMDVMTGLADVLNSVMNQICEIDDSLDYIPPADRVMWSALNAYARAHNPAAAPIFMDRVNYISVKLPRKPARYGRPMRPAKHGDAQLSRAISRYDAVILAALSASASCGAVKISHFIK